MKRMKAAVLLTAMMGTLCVPTVGWADETEDHEPITIMDANRDYTQLIELVHEKYPEINIEIIPYKGRNATAYMKKQLETGKPANCSECTSEQNSLDEKDLGRNKPYEKKESVTLVVQNPFSDSYPCHAILTPPYPKHG